MAKKKEAESYIEACRVLIYSASAIILLVLALMFVAGLTAGFLRLLG